MAYSSYSADAWDGHTKPNSVSLFGVRGPVATIHSGCAFAWVSTFGLVGMSAVLVKVSLTFDLGLGEGKKEPLSNKPSEEKKEDDGKGYRPVVPYGDDCKWLLGPEGIDNLGIPEWAWNKVLAAVPALKCLKIPTRAWATAKLLRMVYDDIHLVLTGWTLLTYWGKDPDACARKPNGEIKQLDWYGCQKVKHTVQYNFGLAIIEYAVILMIYKCE